MSEVRIEKQTEVSFVVTNLSGTMTRDFMARFHDEQLAQDYVKMLQKHDGPDTVGDLKPKEKCLVSGKPYVIPGYSTHARLQVISGGGVLLWNGEEECLHCFAKDTPCERVKEK